MTNNNCNHQNESGNFCGQCGIALKEKCPECGEMEKIGRKVCLLVLKKIESEKSDFISNKTNEIKTLTPWTQLMLGFLVVLIGGPGFMMIIAGGFAIPYQPYLILCGAILVLTSYVLYRHTIKKLKNAAKQ